MTLTQATDRLAADTSSRSRVLIVGAGVAGLETLLALRALAGARVEVTLLAPEPKFIDPSMAVDQPFEPQRVHGVRLQDIADERQARWHRGALDRLEHARRRAVTKDGHALDYDAVVLAPGARTTPGSDSRGVITFRGVRGLPIAESVEPVISSDTSICRRGSLSAENEVMIGTEASQTASNIWIRCVNQPCCSI